MFGAYGAPLDIVNDVCIDARPIHCLSGLRLHFLNPLVCTMKVRKGPFEELWEMQTLSPFRRILAMMASSSWNPSGDG